jgi:hypothetical protein
MIFPVAVTPLVLLSIRNTPPMWEPISAERVVLGSDVEGMPIRINCPTSWALVICAIVFAAHCLAPFTAI